ncbi:LPS assembly protein LptD [uncultured Tateyamaria sp.]|uniref:LPS-assembly protein LptD n=1 Tax=uncultured Tateyamaria sp. TaxID=455651 RepID=UPI002627908B|nr:LPS assembly protein LptD [uncultured Tateyamaria sp.]
MQKMADRFRIWGCTALLIAALIFGAGIAEAQEGDGNAPVVSPAVLVADDIQVTPDRRLIATGNVEAFQDGTRLTAQSIEYNQDTGALTITGPITLDDGQGSVIVASQAELTDDFQTGLLTGARLVLNDQLQLASVQMNRVGGGKYTQLYKVAATSCRICEKNGKSRPPLWQIRASKVIHDKEARQLYFDNATLLVRDIPIFYLPRLRMPDPTVSRTNGFLFPELVVNSLFGTGIKTPYFVPLGDSSDLLITPYIADGTRTLQLRYRKLFKRGRLTIEGATSDDDLQPGESRGYLFAAGEFQLRRDFILQFDIEAVSDDSYLSNYGFSGKDRLDSQIKIQRARRDEFIRLSYINFKSIRGDEDDDVLPSDVVNALYERRFFPGLIGGEIRLAAEAQALERASDVPTDVNGDGVVDGRDVLRLSVDTNWLRTFQMGGLQLQTQLGIAGDAIRVSEDATADDGDSSIAPHVAVGLRYPLIRRSESGVTQFIEPLAQLAWVGGDGLDVPNEESTRVEFGEGNLLSLSRFPETDRRERGWAFAYGTTWARIDPEGWTAHATFGQVIREESQPDFTESSGLSGLDSDFLLAGQLEFDGGLAVSGRTLFDESFDITKAEMRGSWSNAKFSFAGTYIWVDEDPVIELEDPINEFTFGGSYRIDQRWNARANMRYDLELGRAATAGGSLTYRNECVRVDLSVQRRFASSTTIEPATTLGVSVSLEGFSANGGPKVDRKTCGKHAG